MTDIKQFPRRPDFINALNINDLKIGKEISVVCSYGNVALSGQVTDLPEYGEKGWGQVGLSFEVGGNSAETDIDPYDVGLVCAPDGRWSDNHVISSELL